MDDVKKEISALLVRLAAPSPQNKEGVEAMALFHVTQVAAAFESAPHRIDKRMAVLHHFWIESVPWCSGLSKELEKVLIMYGEAAEKKSAL